MVIQKTLNNIRKQPEHVRKYIAYCVTIVCAVILIGIWFLSIANPRFNITKTDIASLNEQDFTVIKDGISDIIERADIDSFQDGLQENKANTVADDSEVLNDETQTFPSEPEQYPWEQ
ncbi:hypothetical protein A2997_01395 [Candidatus Nomurabacteria bacterium RIFCSPLOWO2_01_FULL_36_10b]|uniref:Uncharacterized protein n=1 Tax=Candidatus Nomurabacteria bacterium RIFCSPLOWO2_01_FULL_36_10b TaxID=1801766 RepID=A0A1F6WNH0_9BACT|nr:MAG: hypothetical protein A2997_01395 [Candidatus Nomurabacteria bacterium RIFCSPLOWO2_01_FULL_36_10b]